MASQLLDESAQARPDSTPEISTPRENTHDATDASRRNAKARTITVFLPTLSEPELDQLDAELLRILAARDGAST